MLGTIIVGALLAIAVGAIIYRMIKVKKQGKSISCGCDCEHCGGCHTGGGV